MASEASARTISTTCAGSSPCTTRCTPTARQRSRAIDDWRGSTFTGETSMRILKISATGIAIFIVLLTTALHLTSLSHAAESALNTAAIERLTGAKGVLDQKEGVFKLSAPRKDLSVIVAGVKMSPPMGLTSWAA